MGKVAKVLVSVGIILAVFNNVHHVPASCPTKVPGVQLGTALQVHRSGNNIIVKESC